MIQKLNTSLSGMDKRIAKMEWGIIDLNAPFDRQSQEVNESKSIDLDTYQSDFKEAIR